jgi:hypothetical protein
MPVSEQHGPDNGPDNNMAAVRQRAELFADRMVLHQLTPLQAGYVAVFHAITESARQIRAAAAQGLRTPGQLEVQAERLDAIAADTVLLAQAETG